MTSYRLFENQQLPGPLPVVIAVPEGWDLYDNPLPQCVFAAVAAPGDGYRENVLVNVYKATPVEEVLGRGTASLLADESAGATVLAEHLSGPVGEGATGSGFLTVGFSFESEGQTFALDQTHFAVLLPVNFEHAVPRTLALVTTASTPPGAQDARSLAIARTIVASLGFPGLA